jgi:hypothetical protein
VTSQWDKTTKKTKKITGQIIGKINPSGELIPSRRRDESQKKKSQNKFEFHAEVSVKEYGLSHFFLFHLRDVCAQLQACFPEHWPYILEFAEKGLLVGSNPRGGRPQNGLAGLTRVK